jgi:antibiotic biosynthesis monooxygenase (ABM) superfamily enzyme
MEQDGPVTVVVRHRVRPGKEAEFEEWLRGISGAARSFEGHRSLNVVRPGDLRRPEYLVFFQFDTFANLEKWEKSEERLEWLKRVAPLTVRSSPWERHTGMEVWFSPHAGQVQPPRWKMAIVTLLAIYPLVLLVQVTVAPLLEPWPLLLRTLVISSLFVCLMTYVVMPLMTNRVFGWWLYGPARE